MFNFQERDDGFLVIRDSDGRSVAHVDTKDLVTVTEVSGKRLASPATEAKDIPREKWRIHFTACRLTPDELTELAARISQCQQAELDPTDTNALDEAQAAPRSRR